MKLRLYVSCDSLKMREGFFVFFVFFSRAKLLKTQIENSAVRILSPTETLENTFLGNSLLHLYLLVIYLLFYR